MRSSKGGMFYPLQFRPVFQERIWGGRKLEELYGKELPAGKAIGESWEVSDREEAQSVVVNGPLAGKTLRDLMKEAGREVMGKGKSLEGRFPLLVKILDAREKLSLQVHPPAEKAKELGGEPKTEMWYIAAAEPGASLYVGLRKGVTREEFERRIREGTVADCFHRVEVKAGDTMFLPSGRVHAIGGGLVIFEIQQNSDTTYRVFDWNRVDAQGKGRELHVKESLECIDWEDFEPEVTGTEALEVDTSTIHIEALVEDPLFTVELVTARPGAHLDYSLRAPKVVGVISGTVKVLHAEHPVELRAGEFCLLPAGMGRAKLESQAAGQFLVAEPGN